MAAARPKTTSSSSTTAPASTLPRRQEPGSNRPRVETAPRSKRRPLNEPTELPQLDLERIIATFNRHDVDYLLVGGAASQAHGARRPTFDVDAVPSFDDANLHRLVAALRDLGARIRAAGFDDDQAKDVADAMLHPDTFKNAASTNWTTDAGPVDILRDLPDLHGERHAYEDLSERAITFAREGLAVRVAALDDIIASKTWADRPKDREGLPELRRLAERNRPELTPRRPTSSRQRPDDRDLDR